MKHAILITAYKNFNHLLEIVEYFDNDFYLFIHIDKKIKIPSEILIALEKSEVVKLVSQKFKTNWGGFNHLQCMLYLAMEALKRSELQYFHLISGQDFPVKKLKDLKFFFENNKEKNYLSYHNLPFYNWSSEGGYDRLYYYRFYDFMNYKIEKQRYRIRHIVNFQKNLNFKRSFPKKFPKLFGGSTWWSLNREAIDYVINYSSNNKRILSRFKYTFCPEEFYFPTVLLNSNLKVSIVNNNKRFIIWEEQHGSNPAILNQSNFNSIITGNDFFARKFDENISSTLISSLKKRINA